MQARRANLGGMSYSSFVGMAHSCGFFVHAPQGSVVAIPGGYLCFMAAADAETGMSYLRWSVLPKAEVDGVRLTLEEMMRSYTFLAATDYGSVLKLCTAVSAEEQA